MAPLGGSSDVLVSLIDRADCQFHQLESFLLVQEMTCPGVLVG